MSSKKTAKILSKIKSSPAIILGTCILFVIFLLLTFFPARSTANFTFITRKVLAEQGLGHYGVAVNVISTVGAEKPEVNIEIKSDVPYPDTQDYTQATQKLTEIKTTVEQSLCPLVKDKAAQNIRLVVYSQPTVGTRIGSLELKGNRYVCQ